MDESDKVREAPSPYGEQDAYGNSVDSLRLNLKLTPLERLIKAETAAKGLLRLKHALKPIR